MTDQAVLPEDRLDLPPEWAAKALPRRSNRVRGRFALVADAPALVREQIAKFGAGLTSALEKTSGDPVLARAGLDFLAGAPTPTGAAVVTELLRYTGRYRDRGNRGSATGTPLDRELYSAWVIEFGLPFAVGAAIARAGITTGWDRPGGATAADPFPFIAAADPHAAHWKGSRFLSELELSRELTAAAGPDEYEAVVAMAATHRGTLLQRAAAALLLPDEAAWVASVCVELAGAEHASGLQHLMWTSIGSADQLKLLGLNSIEVARLTERDVAELVCHLGVAALPVLTATLKYKSLTTAQRTALLEGLALLPSDDATALLIEQSGEPQVLPAALRSAARFPLRTARIAADLAPGLAPLDRARLAVIVRSDPAALAAALPHLSEAERATITDLTAATDLPVADAARLPQLLIAPPWTGAQRPAPAPLTGLEPPADIELVWAPEEYERAMSVEPRYWSWDEDEYWDSINGDVVNRVDLSLEDGIWGQLARNGASAADAVAERLRTKYQYAGALVPIRSAAAAMIIADWFLRLKITRTCVLDWLDRHGEAGATLLIPAAFGKSKRHHAGGQAALRHLARQLGNEAVVRSAERYGPAAVQRVEALLDTDPLVPLGDPPRPGAWADPDLLPPVLLRERDAVLPRSAVVHLIGVLACSAPRLHYPGTDTVADHCDAESLTQFSHALFQRWLSAGRPSGDTWAVDQLARFGTDATVAILEPLVLTRTVGDSGLDVLAAIGTDAAFNVLYRMSRLPKYPVTTAVARTLVEQLAARRGEEVEALADRLVPDLGLSEPDTLALDYGPRRFHVRFDERLRPSVVDDAGKFRQRLPQPGVRDDADLAAAAKARHQALVKGLERLVAEQAERLDDAMRSGRTWSVPEFRLIARHPVLGSLVRRLVWLADHDGSRFGFRAAEDGGLADVHERLVELPAAATVRLAHPALLGEELPAWNEIFNDYAILQPIDQLGRPALALTAAEAESGRLTRFEGVEMHTGTLRELMSWVSGFPRSGEWSKLQWGFERKIPGGYLLADLSAGAPVTDRELDEWHRVYAVRLVTTRNRDPKAVKPLRGDRLDPVLASELLAGLTVAIRPR